MKRDQSCGVWSAAALLVAGYALGELTEDEVAVAQDELAASCINADPNGVLTNIRGDFELAVDPQDAAWNIVFVANVADGASSVAVAWINGRSGQVAAGSLTTIANNFNGVSRTNGPEFVQRPSGELGVLYASTGGVRAVYRSATPSAWNAFWFDVTGAPTNGSPPLLSNTSAGAYPAVGMPFGQDTYAQWHGSCTGICYASVAWGTATDVRVMMESRGSSYGDSVQNPRGDRYVLVSGCNASNVCGIYEARINGSGGIVGGSFQRLAVTTRVANVLAAERHPVTGTIVVFSQTAGAIDVWEQRATGGALTLVRRVPVISSEHYRSEHDANKVVLHYLIYGGTGAGSYTIAVTAAPGGGLVAADSKKVSASASGAEIIWMPAANRWAIFAPQLGHLTRCSITP